MAQPQSPTQGGLDIFMSHSQLDLQPVRAVRNELENRGHNPLMFFLRGVDDDAELTDLILREIEARTFFLLCDSENARRSRWVQQEVEMVKALPEKLYEQVDLAASLDEQLDSALELVRRGTVFLSYQRLDMGAVQLVAREFESRGFRTSVDIDLLNAGDDFGKKLDEATSAAVSARDGFGLVFLSPETLSKEFLRREWEALVQAAERAGRPHAVVPVLLREPQRTRECFAAAGQEGLLDSLAPVDLSGLDQAEWIRPLIERLRRADL